MVHYCISDTLSEFQIAFRIHIVPIKLVWSVSSKAACFRLYDIFMSHCPNTPIIHKTVDLVYICNSNIVVSFYPHVRRIVSENYVVHFDKYGAGNTIDCKIKSCAQTLGRKIVYTLWGQ